MNTQTPFEGFKINPLNPPCQGDFQKSWLYFRARFRYYNGHMQFPNRTLLIKNLLTAEGAEETKKNIWIPLARE